MRRSVSLLLAAGLFAATIGIRDLRAADPPRLLVTVVVDQLRADYLQLFNRHWRGGFRTLLDEGMVFENAHYAFSVDRDKPPDQVADVCVHVEKETDAGIYVSGA